MSAATIRSEEYVCRHPGGCPLRSSLSALELVTSAGCSLVTTVYCVEADRSTNGASYASAADVFSRWRSGSLHLQTWAPGVMFMSCLGLGCCVLCFLHRNQHRDQYQPLVFASGIVGSVVVGHSAGASLYLILLAYVPWALCMAMFLSACGHALLRWMGAKTYTAEAVLDEKAVLVP